MALEVDRKALQRQKFQDVFNVIRDELVAYVKAQGMPEDAAVWLSKVSFLFTMQISYSLPTQNLDYNVPGGKLNRGLAVVETVEILKGRELTFDEHFESSVLGWCVELVRANVVVRSRQTQG